MKNSPKTYSPDRAGFTLIELVVAILIFALGIMGIMKMHSASVQSDNYSMQLTEALTVAENRLELMRGLSFTSTSMSAGTHTTTNVFRGTPYTISYTVIADAGTVPTRTVNMRVSWKEKTLDHQVQMNVRWDEFNAGK